MSQGDYARARSHFRHVRELRVERDAPHLAAQALMGRANCDRAQGMAASARDHAQQAVSFARYTGSGEVLANSLMTLAMIEFDAGEMRTAVGYLEEAVSLLESLDDMEGRCRAENLLSYCHSARGEFDAALRHAQRGLRLASEGLPVPLLVSALVAVGNCLWGTGQYERSLAEYQRGAAASERIGYTYGMVLCWTNIACSWAELGDVEQCLAAEERVRTLSLQLPIPRLISAAAFDAGLALDQAGDLPEARRFYEASLEIRRQLGQDALILDSLAGLLRVALGTDERDEARSLLAEIESRVAARGVEGVEQAGWLYLTLVRATLAVDAHARAAGYLDEAVGSIRERADRMTDATMRASYLTNIRSHRELLALSSTVVRDAN
jgi:tetratricopeptide (TPR) repeat protein